MTRMAPTPQILFCGDPHGQFEHILDLGLRLQPDAIVLLGDITAPRPLSEVVRPLLAQGIQVGWILGNHDAEDPAHFHALTRDKEVPGLLALDGRVVTVQGRAGGVLRLAGLGGVFRGRVWSPGQGHARGTPAERGTTRAAYLASTGKGNRWHGGLPLRHRATIFADQWLGLAAQRADVLVTHEAPHFHPYGFRAIHELAVRLGARYSFHGHQHETRHYGVHDGVQGFGVSMRGIMDLEGRVLVEGEHDVT